MAAPRLGSAVPVVSLTKGIEQGSLERMTEIIDKVTEGHDPSLTGVLTGPNLAAEILAGQPTASVIAMPDQSAAERPRTTVPQQALFLMNSPFVIEQAKQWARRSLVDERFKASDAAGRIRQLYQEAFAREPSEEESGAALTFLEQQAAEYKLPSAEAGTDERPWADLCHVLMNVKEFIFIP